MRDTEHTRIIPPPYPLACHTSLTSHRLDELVSPTPDGEYTGRAVVKLIFNIGKVSYEPSREAGRKRVEKSRVLSLGWRETFKQFVSLCYEANARPK